MIVTNKLSVTDIIQCKKFCVATQLLCCWMSFSTVSIPMCTCTYCSLLLAHLFIRIQLRPHWWCCGQRACLECGRPCVRVTIGSNQRIYNWYLLLLRIACSTMEKKQSGRLRIMVICQSGAICLPVDCCFSELALLLKVSLNTIKKTNILNDKNHFMLLQ